MSLIVPENTQTYSNKLSANVIVHNNVYYISSPAVWSEKRNAFAGHRLSMELGFSSTETLSLVGPPVNTDCQ